MPRVGLLFPGEMGAFVGAAARAEVLWAGDGRSEATRRRADEGGFRDVGSLEALVAASEIVLSVCPPAIAEEVATAVGRSGFTGLFVEANAIAPARAERISRTLRDLGTRVVDGSIIASGPTNLYLSGEEDDVEAVAALFAGTEVVAIPLPGGIGAASALKMAFGGWNKIGVALSAQAFAIARAYGLEAALEAEGVEPGPVVRGGRKAWRWTAEMEEVAETCASLGLPDEIARGAAELFSRWDEHRDRTVELDRLLGGLTKNWFQNGASSQGS